MRPRYDRSIAPSHEISGTVFERLGGELSAVDPWTRVDGSWLDAVSRSARDAVGYRGLSAAFRVAGLTLGDADAAPMCPPFMVEICSDHVMAQVVMSDDGGAATRLATCDQRDLQRWAGGSLSKDLRVLHFEDGDVGLEATVHLGGASTAAVLREFVTAFSWDVAALHAAAKGSELVTTEEWVQRAALSISRSTPAIPLREHPSPDWQAYESPTGVFCSLQPSGGLAASDNVLYAVRRNSAALEAVATMPGHRNDWDYTRLTDVWLARDGATVFGRNLLGAGFVHIGGSDWHPLDCEAVTAATPFGSAGFLLGLYGGNVQVVHAADVAGPVLRLARTSGRFSQLVAVGDRAIGLVGATLVSARLVVGDDGARTVADAWTSRMTPPIAFEHVAAIDVDDWSHAPAVSVLGDDALVILDAHTGRERSRVAIAVRHARWIGPGWLMVLEAIKENHETRSRIRVLDTVRERWTAPVTTAEITRIAVRGDEIHVGYANQSIAVWDRAEVCRGIGAFAFVAQGPGDHGTGRPEAAPRPDAQGIEKP